MQPNALIISRPPATACPVRTGREGREGTALALVRFSTLYGHFGLEGPGSEIRHDEVVYCWQLISHVILAPSCAPSLTYSDFADTAHREAVPVLQP